MKFLKMVFATIMGILLAVALLGIGSYLYLTKSSVPNLPQTPNSILNLDFSGPIPELSGNVTESIYGSQGESIGLHDYIKIIRHATSDENIKGIVIKSKWIALGQASISELRKELEKFKESGKFIWSYADYYSQSSYWLSTVSDSIFLNPNGFIDLKGYGSSVRFYKDLMDKTGVEMNIFYAGKFKSATEPYRRNRMSDDNKQQIRSFLGEMKEIMVADVSNARALHPEKVNYIINEYKAGDALSCVQYQLVDGLEYESSFNQLLRKRLGIDKDSKISMIEVSRYHNNLIDPTSAKSTKKIALIYAEGNIEYNSSKKGVISSSKYQEIIESIKKDPAVESVVLRVNSPGGSSYDSDNIHQLILELRQAGKPVIASFGDYAASGGYYLACGADTIIAQENTLTGSIGVFIMFPNVQEMLKEKLGISYDTVKTNPYSVSFTNVFDLTEGEIKYLQNYTDALYDQFLEKVALGRDMSKDEVHEIAQGRVWTGKKALSLGLVDAIGGLDDAINIAAEKAKLEEYKIEIYPKIKVNPLRKLLHSVIPSPEELHVHSRMEQELIQLLNQLRQVSSDRAPLAALPYQFHWD